MNYEDMSDFEINELVAIVTGQVGKIGLVKVSNGKITDSSLVVKDYCNNPSDAWSIIFDNDINLSKHKADDYWFAFVRAEDLGVSEFKCKDNNPLRAAMICFLKMKDAEK